MVHVRYLWFVSYAILASACADSNGDAPPRDPVDVTLKVWNLSHYTLKKLFVHGGTAYQGAPNLLVAPLEEQAEVQVPFTTGRNVTVIRDKNLGEEIALTTGTGLDIYNSACTLIVLNEAFQLQGDPQALDVQDDGAPAGD